MELRDKDKEIMTPSSLGYYNSADHPERRRRGGRDHQYVLLGNDASSQTQDHPRHHFHAYYHHQRLQTDKPTRRDPDPDPVSSTSAAPKPNPIMGPPPSSQPSTPPPRPSVATTSTVVRYRECQKNHAASNGGHVVDGCGEFMPNGEEGTPEALRCAACDCHRSFHRKEIDDEHMKPNFNNYSQYSFYNIVAPDRSNPQRNSRNQILPYHHPQPPQPRSFHRYASPIMVSFGGGGGGGCGGGPAESSTENVDNFHQSFDINGGDQQQPKKRFRTKFNQEQKGRMLEFAEKLEWRITTQHEEEVQRFCEEVNIKRQVFKVWMHNNKQAMKRKQM